MNRDEISVGCAAFTSATRIQESLTSGVERKFLIWAAQRMPALINSDHLTSLGFISMALSGVSYAWTRWHPAGLLLATLFLALNWLGDSLDGTLARVRNCQRPRYGFYVDHIIDSFGALFLMGGLAASKFIDWRVAMGMLVAFLLLSIESYLATYTLGTFRMSFAKFGPTEIRVLLAAGNVELWVHPNATFPGLSYRLFDAAGLIAIAGMGVMVVAMAIRHTIVLYKMETAP